ATAAVLLSGSPPRVDPASPRGMSSLVSSSVKGLKPANVSITDASGTLLWPNSDSSAGSGGANKLTAQARYNTQLQGSLDAMLVQTLGADKARVQVSSDLNVDETSLDKLTYAKNGVPLKTTDETERLRGTGGASGGTTGSASNLPSYATSGSAGGNSSSQRKSTQTDFGVDKTVQRTKVAPGQVNRLSVGLVVDKSVPPAQVAQIK